MEEEGLYYNDSALDSTRKHADKEDFGEIFCQGIHVLACVVFQ